ncbi:MAG: hypothetical protein IT427_00035 [Pirellulales bacterium]|nr:hypothetical protein [Pirellulales bacterium]
MKRIQWVLAGVVLLAICGWLASPGAAQLGQQEPKPVVQSAPRLSTVLLGLPGIVEKKISIVLGEPVDFDFIETPLQGVLDYIKDHHGLQIVFESNVLSAAGIDPATLLITTNLKGISLRSALRLLLSAQGLTYYINDEVLKITTIEQAESVFGTRLYDVRDLITDDRQLSGPPDFDSIIKVITTSVQGNWKAEGGGAAICEFCSGGIRAIAVNQTYEGHTQIESLLAGLRKLRPQQ